MSATYEKGRTSSLLLNRVDGVWLRVRDINGWDFDKMKRSSETLV